MLTTNQQSASSGECAQLTLHMLSRLLTDYKLFQPPPIPAPVGRRDIAPPPIPTSNRQPPQVPKTTHKFNQGPSKAPPVPSSRTTTSNTASHNGGAPSLPPPRPPKDVEPLAQEPSHEDEEVYEGEAPVRSIMYFKTRFNHFDRSVIDLMLTSFQ